MPCDYRILQSPPKGQVLLVLLETVQRSLINACILILKTLPTLDVLEWGEFFFNNWEYISLLRLTDEATHTIAHLHLEASIAIGW